MTFRHLLTLSASSSTATSSTPSVGVSTRRSTLSSSSSEQGDESIVTGCPFVEMMKDHPHYKCVLRCSVQYEIKLVHGTTSNLHWYLLIKIYKSDFPYVTLEVTTSDMNDLIPTIRTVMPDDGVWSQLLTNDPTDLGVYCGALFEICTHADDVVKDMGTYHLLRKNCQHFCNNLLLRLGKIDDPYPTTVPIDSRSDFLSVIINKVYDTAVSSGIAAAGAYMLNRIVGAPMPIHSRIDDLDAIFRIIKPLAKKWKEIGSKLSISSENISKIEREYGRTQFDCLREMLREHLEQSDSLEQLADVIVEYSQTMSEKIRHRAPTDEQHFDDQ